MEPSLYAERIRYRGPLYASPETLCDLHLAHLLAVPFENLDIHLGRPIDLEPEALFGKVVTNRRGGFCYELNGLFACMLRRIGFTVSMLAAGVSREDGSFGPPFDHMALLVQGGWLADVGFGEGFRLPLRLTAGTDQRQDGSTCRLEREGPWWTLFRDAKPQYRFTLEAHEPRDFAPMCLHHQTSPDSSFTRGRLCTLATPGGRLTLTDARLIETAAGQRTERHLSDDREFRAVLREEFGIDIP